MSGMCVCKIVGFDEFHTKYLVLVKALLDGSGSWAAFADAAACLLE
jgi:hypothetical protein